ncbi:MULTISPECIES: NUDIX domain-containing protein [unclassified Nocardioides]|uniref:NUDIX domain-containing protein n=1 Tax=unclassified Nocardioides TaxID=2615069 RepID=UPI0011534AD4|nr:MULTISPECIES: NUDIX hydrolase [unclassified Nocardioides]TQK70901.1 ADP-ribose pyrophosphatase [Nocardioides sp. SLBN-35]WGX99712.1 NUDIX hydrolase [Nocardioides sp. QY071]
MSDLRDVPESWPVEDSVDLHRDGWVVAFRSDRIRRPGAEDEEPFRRLVLEHPGAAVVLAIDDEDRVLCLKQYRHPAQSRLVELPAGVIDHPGEDPEDVARRELREEAALAAERWTHLLSTLSSPGYSAERIHYYLAEGLAPADRGDFELRHEEADLEVLWVPFADLVDAILAGDVTDGPVVQAVLAVQVRRDREAARG